MTWEQDGQYCGHSRPVVVTVRSNDTRVSTQCMLTFEDVVSMTATALQQQVV